MHVLENKFNRSRKKAHTPSSSIESDRLPSLSKLVCSTESNKGLSHLLVGAPQADFRNLRVPWNSICLLPGLYNLRDFPQVLFNYADSVSGSIDDAFVIDFPIEMDEHISKAGKFSHSGGELRPKNV